MDFYDPEILSAEILGPKHVHKTTFMNRSEAGKKHGDSPIHALSIGENAVFNAVILTILLPC